MVAERVLRALRAEGIQGAQGEPAQLLVNRSCVKCHGPEGQAPNLTDLSKVQPGALLKVFNQILSGQMPKNAPKLSDDEINVFLRYLSKRGGAAPEGE